MQTFTAGSVVMLSDSKDNRESKYSGFIGKPLVVEFGTSRYTWFESDIFGCFTHRLEHYITTLENE